MVKFEPQFQIKCIGRGEGDERLILEVIDMYWDPKRASRLPLVTSEALSRYNPVIWVGNMR